MGAKAASTPQAATPQPIKQVRVQSSAYGLVIPLVYGLNRVAGNVIWLDNFQAIRHDTAQSSSAKSGGRVVQTTYTYSASAMFALCEGPAFSLGTAVPGRSPAQGARKSGAIYTPGVWKFKKTLYAVNVGADGKSLSPSAGFWPFRGWTDPVAGAGTTVPGCPIVQGAALLGNIPGTGSPYWQHVANAFADEALAYPRIAYAAGRNLDLGSNASLPNYNFPVIGLRPHILHYGPAPRSGRWEYGTDPADLIHDVLTDEAHGIGFPGTQLGNWYSGVNGYSASCRARLLTLSPIYDSQQTAGQLLTELMTITQAAIVWTEGLLKIIPYADEAITSETSGQRYDPTVAPGDGDYSADGAYLGARYALTDDDFLHAGDTPPLEVERQPAADVENAVQVEWSNPTNAYAAEIAEAKDDASIALLGGAVRAAQPVKFHGLTDGQVARDTAQRLLQQKVAKRNVYRFRLGWHFIRLDPMDVVTLTDAALGLAAQPVRLTSVSETSDGDLEIEAEDLPVGVHTAASYGSQAGVGVGIDYNADGGPVRQVVAFEPPFPLVSEPELWIAAAGDAATWGGAIVLLSEDGEDFASVGTIQPAPMGYVVSPVPASPGTDDATSAPTIILRNNATLRAFSVAQAQALRSLLYVGRGGQYELVAYSAATFQATSGPYSVYQLGTYLRRGAYGTPHGAIGPWADLLVLDGTVCRVPIPARWIGRTVQVKLLSFNPYGGGAQDLGDVDVTSVRLTGVVALRRPGDVTDLRAVLTEDYTALSWARVSDDRPLIYEIRKGVTWATAQVLGLTAEPSWRVFGTGSFFVASRIEVADGTGQRQVRYSATPAVLSVSGTPPVRNLLRDVEESVTGWRGLGAEYDDAVLDHGPVAYFRLGQNGLSDDSGNEIVLDAVGGVTWAQPSLLEGDGDASVLLDGASATRLTVAQTEDHSDILAALSGDLGVELWCRRSGSTPLGEEVLIDLRTTSGGSTGLWVSLAPTTGKIRLGKGTTQLVESSVAIALADVNPHYVALTRGTNSVHAKVWLDGVEVADAAAAQSGPDVLTFGNAVGGGKPFAGCLQRIAAFGPAPDVAEIVGRALLGTTAEQRVTFDVATQTVRLGGTTAFDALADVTAAPNIWYAGGVAAQGRYYLPGGHGERLRVATPAKVLVDATVTIGVPFPTFAAIPIVEAVASVSGALDGTSLRDAAGVTFEVARGQRLGRGQWDPWTPLVPGRDNHGKYRLRATLRSTDPTVIAALSSLRFTVDVDDTVQQGRGISVGTGPIQTLAAVTGTAQTNTMVIPVTVTTTAGNHVLLALACSRTQRFSADTLVVTDSQGNAWQLDVTKSDGLIFEAVVLCSARLSTALTPGDTITLTFPDAVDQFAVAAVECGGLAASGWFDRAATAFHFTTSNGPGAYPVGVGTLGTLASAGEFLVSAAALVGPATDVFVPGTNPGGASAQLLGRVGTDRLTVASLCGIASGTTGQTFTAQNVSAYDESILAGIAAYKTAVAGGYVTITFPHRFNVATPTVQIVVENAQAGDEVQLGTITDHNFQVRVVNGGTPVFRAISYLAKGY